MSAEIQGSVHITHELNKLSKRDAEYAIRKALAIPILQCENDMHTRKRDIEMSKDPTLCGFNAVNSAFVGTLTGMLLDTLLLHRYAKFLYAISIENIFERFNDFNSSDIFTPCNGPGNKYLYNSMTLVIAMQFIAGLVLLQGIYKHNRALLCPWLSLKTFTISCIVIHFLNLNFNSKYVFILLSLIYCDVTLFTILCLVKLYQRFRLEEILNSRGMQELKVCVNKLLLESSMINKKDKYNPNDPTKDLITIIEYDPTN